MEGPDDEQRALLLSAATAAELAEAWEVTPAAREWLEGVFRDLANRVEGVVGDPDSLEAQALAGTGAAGLSRVLGLSDDPAARTCPGTDPETRRDNEHRRTGAEAGFLFWREREEDAALSRFKDALAALIEDRARGIGLTLEKGTAPFPGGLGPLGASARGPLVGLPDVSPLSYLRTSGSKDKVADLADALLELGVADFTLFAEDPENVEELRSLGAEVLRGPARGFPDPGTGPEDRG